MRIGVISPLEIRVPPVAYGGTELIVYLLIEELVRLGHDVTLFASGDSITSAELVSVCPQFLRGTNHDKHLLNMLNVATCLERADSFDIIHNHTVLEGMSTAGMLRTPMLTTLHGDLNGDWHMLFDFYKGWFNTISQSAWRLLPYKERFAGVVYNAIDVKCYDFNATVEETYMLFLSRISEEKGPHLAIELARMTGRRLIIAGNVNTPDEEYFKTRVLPGVDGDLVQYVGEADLERKKELMSGAYCLVAPITWAEPFGLFMVEAMACGTPVVVFNRGSAPEVVRHGETGYVVNTLDEMAEAVARSRSIDRECCRKSVEEHFDAPRMARDYLEAYRLVLEGKGAMDDRRGLPASTALSNDRAV
ncbi:MAG: glycosyltransferase family 4 protein [Chloroflexi bacterium]|nr:glycosyltransferase family 4 protein [Chloroflexota bacterium]